MDPVNREFLLSFWKIHILQHASERPVYGQWIAEELKSHGYAISPGTLYPALARMEQNGWLTSTPAGPGPKARRDYALTRKGAGVLAALRSRVGELHREVCGARAATPRRRAQAGAGRRPGAWPEREGLR